MRRFCLYVDIGEESSAERDDLYLFLLEEILDEAKQFIVKSDWDDIEQAVKGRSLKDVSGNRVGRMWVSDPTRGT